MSSFRSAMIKFDPKMTNATISTPNASVTIGVTAVATMDRCGVHD